MGQIQVNSPQIGSSDFINSIVAWEFGENLEYWLCYIEVDLL